ncbi:hypothetical protein KI387_034615 [Taxus chinensis]|uniref:Uncharacterized protein n=1 Tax=Taxus chinensis TaxID=29808 RepID=A0AA38F5K3_TAXCH|nr:hypothetical protein KI387_034615 [Taxus chinensis]
MAATLVAVFTVIAIFTAGGGGGALARLDAHIHNELAQQTSDDNGGVDGGDVGDGNGGGYSSSGGGYGLNPPKDTGDSGSAPTDDGSIPTPTEPDHKPSIPDVPTYGSTPTDNIPHIPEVPMKGTGDGSCDFWSSNFGSWPDILSTMSTIASIFGKPASSMFPSSMTLLQALQNSNSDPYSSLLKQASASMLNAFVYKNFKFSPEDVKAKFGAALTSPRAAGAQAFQFAQANLSLK